MRGCFVCVAEKLATGANLQAWVLALFRAQLPLRALVFSPKEILNRPWKAKFIITYTYLPLATNKTLQCHGHQTSHCSREI